MAQSCANPGCTADGTKTYTRCRQSSYCSRDCQKKNWPKHKATCQPLSGSNDPNHEKEPIRCVKIYSQGEGGGRYEEILLPFSHPIFQSDPLPVSLKFDYPLVLQRLVPNLSQRQETDNQHATWLMIDPVTGFAPPAWQGGIGSVYVARPDRAPLTTEILAAITDYVSDILDHFGTADAWPIVRRYYDRARLERYLVQHQNMQNEYQAALRSLQS